MINGSIIFTFPLIMFFIAGFIVNKIQPNLHFALQAFLVASSGFLFIIILSTIFLQDKVNISIRNPIFSIHTPLAYLTWIFLRLGNRRKK